MAIPVEVWWLDVTVLGRGEAFETLSKSLNRDERDRAARFVHRHDQIRFTVCRGALRHVVGACAGITAAEVEFGYGAHGKPYLKNSGAAGQVEFNLSHAGEWGVVAVCGQAAVGVDVEQIRDARDLAALARRFFAAEEQQGIEALPAAEFVDAFYRVWSRKEAYMKGTGAGLSLGTDTFHVTVGRDDPAPIAPWSFANLALTPPGYAAALAVESPASSIKEQRFAL